MPYTEFDEVFGCPTEVSFSLKYGRLYRPLRPWPTEADEADLEAELEALELG
jgi:hypothetical protein